MVPKGRVGMNEGMCVRHACRRVCRRVYHLARKLPHSDRRRFSRNRETAPTHPEFRSIADVICASALAGIDRALALVDVACASALTDVAHVLALADVIGALAFANAYGIFTILFHRFYGFL